VIATTGMIRRNIRCASGRLAESGAPHQEPDMGGCRPKAAATKSRKKRRRGENAHIAGSLHPLLR